MGQMDGILIIDKPEGMTSHDVVARLRRILKIKKIGHTGTLDPFATGVLVMLVGKATRLARFLDRDIKEYDALINFGYETDTGDRTGTRKETEAVREQKQITPEDLIRVIAEFMGEIKQVPPMYSAKKVDGKKLYEFARKGEEIDRDPIDVTIFKIQISQDRLPAEPAPGTWNLRFLIKCSAGTYIRTLAEDIGRELGPRAHLGELRRTGAGRFDLSQAFSLDDLERHDDPASLLIPMSEAVSDLAEMRLDAERVRRTLDGLPTGFVDEAVNDGDAVRMVDENGKLIAIGTFCSGDNVVQPKVVLG